MKIEIAGENALIIYFAEQVSVEASGQIQAMTNALQPLVGQSIIDLIPSYASLLVIYDDDHYDYYAMRSLILAQSQALANDAQTRDGKLVTLPVYYGLEAAPDLEELAQKAGLTTDEVIQIHQAQTYQAYAIGFAPGFAFLGEVDPRIAAPRKATPRKAVPKGAVAIADRQTAVYPSVSPGGWNLIGLCPTPMFEPEKTPAMPLSTGDRVQFKAISKAEFLVLGGELPSGEHPYE
ncbi:5-oxoprolinase subunit PxpB [Marinomonas agarivorans]|nr:5-oxoprolinase subunit PxpB [Marinomonas agarivorans]